MIKYFLAVFFIVLAVLNPAVEAVLFADDHFTLHEDGKQLVNQTVLIFSNESGILSFEEVYNGTVFVRSQSMVTNLTFYQLNKTMILDYNAWVETKNEVGYSDYIQDYIQGFVNDSWSETTVEITDPEDTEVYNQPLIGTGGIIGQHRYFTIDLKTSSVDLTETKIPESPGFQLIYLVAAMVIIFFMVKRRMK